MRPFHTFPAGWEPKASASIELLQVENPTYRHFLLGRLTILRNSFCTLELFCVVQFCWGGHILLGRPCGEEHFAGGQKSGRVTIWQVAAVAEEREQAVAKPQNLDKKRPQHLSTLRPGQLGLILVVSYIHILLE